MATIDENIEAAVTRSIQDVLEPYLRKLQAPAPQVLARVPHVDGKVLIPIRSVEQLLSGSL